MTAFQFTLVFIAALTLTTAARLWLARRHLAYIAAHRSGVPDAFREQIQLTDHQRAADYTSAKTRFSMLSVLFDAAILLAFTLGGGIQFVSDLCQSRFDSTLTQGLSSLLETPFELYRTFRIEASFGFNNMTIETYLIDMLKNLLIGSVLGLPLLFGVLWLMERMGQYWWFYVWGAWVLFNLLILFIYPSFIAPLFNKFSPLHNDAMKLRIETLLQKCGFTTSGLFVMEHRRSGSGAGARTRALQTPSCDETHPCDLCDEPGLFMAAGHTDANHLVLSGTGRQPVNRYGATTHSPGATAVLHGDADIWLFYQPDHVGLLPQARIRGGRLRSPPDACQRTGERTG
jgi:putative effector of murein hydrolase LrgA (UPF0299 family)